MKDRIYNGLRNGMQHNYISVICTGEMLDGTKVYTEYDRNTKELINKDTQYYRMYNGQQLFMEL